MEFDGFVGPLESDNRREVFVHVGWQKIEVGLEPIQPPTSLFYVPPNEKLDYKTTIDEFAESNIPEYNIGIMDKAAKERLASAARDYGLSVEEADEVLARAAQEKAAARVVKHGADPKPRVKKAKPELTAARLLATYEILVRDSDLANPLLPDEERMRRAIHLRKTYQRLRERNPSFHDDSEQLRLARKLLNSRAYQRRKAAMVSADA
jgi:hypothetical protein